MQIDSNIAGLRNGPRCDAIRLGVSLLLSSKGEAPRPQHTSADRLSRILYVLH